MRRAAAVVEQAEGPAFLESSHYHLSEQAEGSELLEGSHHHLSEQAVGSACLGGSHDRLLQQLSIELELETGTDIHMQSYLDKLAEKSVSSVEFQGMQASAVIDLAGSEQAADVEQYNPILLS